VIGLPEFETASSTVGALAAIEFQQFLDPPDFSRSLIGRQVEADPAIAIFGDTPERRTALAPEEHRQCRATHRLGIGATFSKLTKSPR
jgi:hypothetical protein